MIVQSNAAYIGHYCRTAGYGCRHRRRDGEHGRVDRVVILLASQLAQARENLRRALAETPHDKDFPATLARVRDLGVITNSELAEWAGISRSRLYDLLREADEHR